MKNTTPSPTLEESIVATAQKIIPNKDEILTSSFASVKSDLMEAANAVAQALGSRILNDGSDNTSNKIFSKKEELIKLSHGCVYKWNDWRFLRTKDTLFLWCDAVAIEFR